MPHPSIYGATRLSGAFLLLLLCITASCKKQCDSETATCRERPPTNELCQANFQRWFYNDQTNTCELIGYSGCSERGFATEAACAQCICNE